MILYGFFWTDCVYESAMGLQSLHTSKVGAYRAMVQAQYTRWAECRSGKDSGLHTGMRMRGFDYRVFRSFEVYAVRPIPVLP